MSWLSVLLSILAALTDNSGSVVERYAYTAYGNPTILDAAGTTPRSTSSYGNPYAYTAREYEPDTGLNYYRARYTGTNVSRFLNRDPIGYWGGDNLYAYVGGRPTSLTDPLGLSPYEDFMRDLQGRMPDPHTHVPEMPWVDSQAGTLTAGGRRGMAEIIDSMDGGSLGGEQWRQGHLQNDQRMLQDFGRVLPGMGVLLATRELRTGTDLLGQRRSLDDQMFNVLTLVGGAAGSVHGAGPPSGVGDMWQARRMADIAPSGNPFQHVFRQMDDVLAICSSNCFVAGTRVVTNISREGLDTRPIEELSLGDRVAASNPLRGETSSPSQVDPRTWRTVRLEAHEAGVPYEIALLRPVDWIREHGAQPGARLYLALEEIGMRGVATVTAVGPCPEIEPEDGMQRRVVTATMVHPAPGIVDLQIEGEQDPVGVTAIHPIWSEDRGSFVPAGSLRPGESLKTLDGTLLQVTRITPRRGPPQVVYNLEVDAEHVYGVSARGLVVHNTCPGAQLPFRDATTFQGVRVYQRNDLITPNLTDRMGRTNIQRMQQGLAPIGPDGHSLHLHHTIQSQNSPIAEMTRTFHQTHHRTIHINPNTIPSGINRSVFGAWREQYWMMRAAEIVRMAGI